MKFSISKLLGIGSGLSLGGLGSPAGEERVKTAVPPQGIRFLGSRFLLEGVELGWPLGLSVASDLAKSC